MGATSFRGLRNSDWWSAACNRFDAELRGEVAPHIEDYLREASELESACLFCELFGRELEFLRNRNGFVDLESYRRRFTSYHELVDAIGFASDSPIERSQQILEIYDAALPQKLSEQGSMVDRICAHDWRLREALRSLLGRSTATTNLNFTPGDSGTTCPDQDGSRSLVHDDMAVSESPCSPPTLIGSISGTSRFEILRQLGSGGNGIVYEVYDREREMHMALKLLRHADARSIKRFKGEFRAVADVIHPNLVALHELFVVGPQWFFTMELVKGVEFRQYVRTKINELGVGEPGCSLERLRLATRQLAEGVAALHAAGLLHRDIKSSNVLVTDEGRVVLLDFGLGMFLDPKRQYAATDQDVAGTFAYMSPEQAAGSSLSPTSDWYSVGVMLFESLTGRLPFLGSPMQIMVEKQQREPEAPHELISSVPQDLSSLCVELLRRRPEDRPTTGEILQRIGSDFVATTPNQPTSHVGTQRVPFVGRSCELEQLVTAFHSLQRGIPGTVLVSGRAGVGKTALVQQFLESLPDDLGVVVLKGRCYERESVPYKALDALVDNLAGYLARLPVPTAEVFLPVDLGALGKVFPVMRRVERIAETRRNRDEIPDPQELRRRAFRAFRELLCRLASRTTLVLSIDDLQWGDVDSALLLAELLRPPDSPLMLLIGTHRSEDADNLFLRTLQRASCQPDGVLSWAEIVVEPLAAEEARELAESLVEPADLKARDVSDMRHVLETIVRESDGNPYFVRELVRSLQSGSVSTNEIGHGEELTLDNILWARMTRLPEESRRLLEVVAMSGRPLRFRDAQLAAHLAPQDYGALGVLRAANFVRTHGPDSGDSIECYHDCVRESVVAHLTPESLIECHRSLANALEMSENADPEELAIHLEGGGNHSRASRAYAEAGDRAVALLAFDRAARMYDCAIRLADAGDPQVRHFRRRRGDALANAGRGGEAAHEYLAATVGASAADRLDLIRCAAMQSLISGHIDHGLDSLQIVLKSGSLRWPSAPVVALILLLCRRIRLRWRGFAFQDRDESQIAAEELSRIDTCWSAAIGLTMVDPVRAGYFTTHGLLLALRAGEPYRVARALAMESFHQSISGSRARRHSQKMMQHALQTAKRVDSPHAEGLVTMAQGLVSHLAGDVQSACEFFDRAERVFQDRCTGIAWELDTVQIYRLFGWFFRGEIRLATTHLSRFLKDAEARGDLYAATTMGGLRVEAYLAADDPERARQTLHDYITKLSSQGFHVQHFSRFIAEAHLHLYTHAAAAAWDCARKQRQLINRSLLVRVQFIRVFTAYLHARCALADFDGDPRLLVSADKDAHRLLSDDFAWAKPFALQVLAGIAVRRGDVTTARHLFADAAQDFDRHGLGLYAAASRRRYASLDDTEEGSRMLNAADLWIKLHAAENPLRIADVFAPPVRP